MGVVRGSAGYKQRGKRSVLIALYAATYALLATVYVFYTSSVWAYMGLDLTINTTKIVVSTIVFFGFIIATPMLWGARTFFLNIILTIYLMPSLILYGFSDRPTPSVLMIVLAIAIVYVVSSIPLARLRLYAISPGSIVRFLFVTSGGLVVLFYAFGGFRYFNLDFSKVYEFRSVAAESLPGIFGYLSLLFTTAIIPFGIAISLCYRKYTGVAVFSLTSLILFGLTSHKSMIIIPFLSIGVFVLLSRRPGYATLLAGVAALFFVVAVAAAIAPDMSAFSFWGQIETTFIRRALFVPALVDYNYLEFFSGSSKYYWSTSKLSLGLVHVPYNGISPPLLIGSTYFGADTSANTGFIGSGFAQAGILGVVIYSIGVGLIIAFFQTCSRYMGIPLVITATIGLFTSMIQSTDFVALFLTNGLLPALLILVVMRDQTGAAPKINFGVRNPAAHAPALSMVQK